MRRIAAIFVLISICFSVTGCGKQILSESEKSLDTINLSYTENDVLSEEEYAELKSKIKYVDVEKYLHLSHITYGADISVFEDNCLLGIRAIPVMIDDLFDDEKVRDWQLEDGYIASVIFALLRVDESLEFESIDIGTTVTESYYGDKIRNLFKFSKEKIPEIINSDKEFSQKLEELKQFGVLAVPYVLDETKNGKTEYEEFFIAIGLHVTVLDYCTHCIDHSYESLKTGEVFIGEEDFLYNSEKFDYTEWLSDNQEDLRIIFKYLDENCL